MVIQRSRSLNAWDVVERALSLRPLEVAAERVPRMRFTVRRMMGAVAIVALLLAWVQMRRRFDERRASFEDQSVIHAAHEILQRGGGADVFSGIGEIKPNARRAAYHARMRQKYERAARYPWLPIEPDPPPP